LNINAGNDVTLTNYDVVEAEGVTYKGVDTSATQNRSLDRKINIKAGRNATVQGVGGVFGADTTIVASNTKLDDTYVEYKNLNFVDNSGKVNNVTISNNTELNDTDSTGLKLSTNGNFTVDKTNLLKDGSEQAFIDLTSTGGNVTIANTTGLNTKGGDINLTANKDITFNNAKSTAKGNVNLTAQNGDILERQSTIIASGGSVVANANNVLSQERVVKFKQPEITEMLS